MYIIHRSALLSIHIAALLIHLSTPVTPLICLKTSFQPSGKLGNELPLMYITSALLGPAEPHMTNGVP